MPGPSKKQIWGWRGAASGVVDRLKQLHDTKERSDVQFAVGREHGEEQLFRAHKLVLSSGSDVFDGMFYGEVRETTEKTIEVPDILPQAFATMLKYLYTDVVEDLNLENVLSTLYCSEKYGIPKLFDICVEYAVANVDKSTCLTMLEAAKVLEAELLVSKCLEIVDIHCTELLQSEAFLHLKQETLREIFSRDTLIVDETEVYKAAQRWAINVWRSRGLEPNTANCRLVLGGALFAIRFPLLNDEQLAGGPLTSGLLLTEEHLKIYQVRYAAKKPGIPFSVTPRRSGIVFCKRRWLFVESSTATDGNVFLDGHGHLHLRFAQNEGVWKGAEVQLLGALGFGRYEFHIEGVGRLEARSGFVWTHAAAKGPDFGINFVKVRGPARMGQTNELVAFAVRPPIPMAFSSADTAKIRKTSEGHGHTRLTHSFHWKPDTVLFSCQRGHHHNNTTRGELCKWSYDTGPNNPEISLPLAMRMFPVGIAPADRKEAEIVVHSFHFYPDA